MVVKWVFWKHFCFESLQRTDRFWPISPLGNFESHFVLRMSSEISYQNGKLTESMENLEMFEKIHDSFYLQTGLPILKSPRFFP